jgi:hypothetical protein
MAPRILIFSIFLHCKCLEGFTGSLQENQSAGISKLQGLKKKREKMADFSKSSFFKIANSRKKIAKISQIGPWVSRID